MIGKLGAVFTSVSRRIVPDPFVFVIVLTIVVAVLGKFAAGKTLIEMAGFWGAGLMTEKLLAFTTQICLILITGHALASSPPVAKIIQGVVKLPRTPFMAVYLTTFGTAALGLVNWGFALIGGAIFCKAAAAECRRKGLSVSYPLLVASAYSGLMLQHGGLSGSAPLLVATPGHFLEAQMGVIPITKTLFVKYNLIVNGFLLLALPALMGLMCPKRGQPADEIPDALLNAVPPPVGPAANTLSERLERSVLLTVLIAAFGAIYLFVYFREKGFAGFNINSINTAFLLLGILCHGSPIAYGRAVAEAVKGCGAILIQFPFYAAIMAMMQSSGLVEISANWFVSVASARTFPIYTYVSAAIVNLFIPSGGGQWVAQGPVLIDAAQKIGASETRTLMAFVYGDQITNLLQPFWTLPLLAIAKLHPRDIMGYSAVAFLLGALVMGLGIAFLPE